MTTQNRLRHLFAVALALFSFAACELGDTLTRLEDAEITYDAEYAIPVLNDELSVADILETDDTLSFLYVDPDGLVHVVYESPTIRRSSQDVFDALVDVPVILFDTVQAVPFELPGGVTVDYVDLKSGILEWQAINQFGEPLNVTFSSPQMTKDGTAFSQTITLGVNNNSQSGTFDISDYIIEPDGNQQVFIKYDARRPNNARVELSIIGVIFKNLQYRYVLGFLGSQSYQVDQDSIDISIFTNYISGNIYIADPKVNVTVNNSIGMPVALTVNELYLVLDNGDILPMESPAIDEGIAFAYPSVAEGAVPKNTVFSFNTSNSNIDDIIAAKPVRLIYDIDATLNPDGLTDANFITDDAYSDFKVDVDLPLFGFASNFVFSNDSDIDLSTIGEEVVSGEFKLISENRLPLDADVQMYFLSSDGAVIDSLFAARDIIDGAPVDGNGNVNGTASKTSVSTYNAERFAAIRNSTRVRIETSFSTTGNQTNVRINQQDAIRFKLGLRVGLVQ